MTNKAEFSCIVHRWNLPTFLHTLVRQEREWGGYVLESKVIQLEMGRRHSLFETLFLFACAIQKKI